MIDQQKRAAATYAAGLVEDGMVVGLGSGTTAELMVEELGRRHREGLRFVGVPTSKSTAHLAQSYGIPLTRLDELHELDLTIDGADEVDPDLNLIKGGGGQMVREKLVATAARRFVVIVDERKLVPRLGERAKIPVEVVPFGWTTTRHRLALLGLDCQMRGGDHPYLTSNHNFILDCQGTDIASHSPKELANAIKALTGVVDHGLFFGMTSLAIVGTGAGKVELLTPEKARDHATA